MALEGTVHSSHKLSKNKMSVGETSTKEIYGSLFLLHDHLLLILQYYDHIKKEYAYICAQFMVGSGIVTGVKRGRALLNKKYVKAFSFFWKLLSIIVTWLW